MQRSQEAFQSAADLKEKPLQNQSLSLMGSDHSRATLTELFDCSGRQVINARMHMALYGREEVFILQQAFLLAPAGMPAAPAHPYA